MRDSNNNKTRPQDISRKTHPEVLTVFAYHPTRTPTIYTHYNIIHQHNISIESTDKNTQLLQKLKLRKNHQNIQHKKIQ